MRIMQGLPWILTLLCTSLSGCSGSRPQVVGTRLVMVEYVGRPDTDRVNGERVAEYQAYTRYMFRGEGKPESSIEVFRYEVTGANLDEACRDIFERAGPKRGDRRYDASSSDRIVQILGRSSSC